MAGAFIPGQVMSLRKLAAAFGTSPMPIRDVLGQLVAANVLEETPNRSVRVPRLSVAKLGEVFEVRDVIEGMAAKGACRNISPMLIAELDAINKEMVAAIARRDVQVCLSANQRFHFRLYEAAASDVLMPLIESLWLRSGPTLYFSFLMPDVPWDASEHREILAGLRDGNAGAVGRALSRDIRNTARHMLSQKGIARLASIQLPAGDVHVEM